MVEGKCECGHEVSGDLPSYVTCEECNKFIEVPGGYDPIQRACDETDMRVAQAVKGYRVTAAKQAAIKREAIEKPPAEFNLTEIQIDKCVEALKKKEWKWFLYDWIGVSKEWGKNKKFEQLFPQITHTELQQLMSEL